MIRHLLMFRWTEDSSPEDRAAAVKALTGLKNTVPSIKSITVQEALNPGERSFDALLEAHFEDADGYQAYLTNDSHIAAWLNFLQPVSTELASIQVEHRGQPE